MIFITGASGLAGGHIAQDLVGKGFQVTALKRAGSDLSFIKADIRQQITWLEGDVLEPLVLEKAMQGCTTVIHAAAMVSFEKGALKKMYQTNVEGTANIVNAALLAGVKQLIHISSVAALGRSKPSVEINEKSKWEKSGYNTNYALTKYLSELEAWRGHAEGLSTTILNPSVIIGPGDLSKSSGKIFKYVAEEKPFYTLGTVNYVDVRDIATIIHQLIKNPVDGERFILSSGHTTYKLLFETIAQSLEKKAPRIAVGKKLMQLAYYWETFKSIITGSKPLVTKEMIRVADKHFYYSNQKAQRQWNFEFRSLNESIVWTKGELESLNQL